MNKTHNQQLWISKITLDRVWEFQVWKSESLWSTYTCNSCVTPDITGSKCSWEVLSFDLLKCNTFLINMLWTIFWWTVDDELFLWDHCQRSSPLRISEALWAGLEPAENLSLGLAEWSCAVVMTTTSSCHLYYFTKVTILAWSVKHGNFQWPTLFLA